MLKPLLTFATVLSAAAVLAPHLTGGALQGPAETQSALQVDDKSGAAWDGTTPYVPTGRQLGDGQPMPRVADHFTLVSGAPEQPVEDQGAGAGERAELREATLDAWQAQRRTPCDLGAQHAALRMTSRYIAAKLEEQRRIGEAASDAHWKTAEDIALSPYLRGPPSNGSISSEDLSTAVFSSTPQGAVWLQKARMANNYSKPHSRPPLCGGSTVRQAGGAQAWPKLVESPR